MATPAKPRWPSQAAASRPASSRSPDLDCLVLLVFLNVFWVFVWFLLDLFIFPTVVCYFCRKVVVLQWFLFCLASHVIDSHYFSIIEKERERQREREREREGEKKTDTEKREKCERERH